MNQEVSDGKEKISEKLLRWLFVGFKLSEIEKAGLSVEGKIITARDLFDYAGFLRFSTKSLEGKKILDFGCGASNIGEDLKEKGINATVVGVDLVFDPYSNRNGIPPLQALLHGLNLLIKSMPIESRTRENLLRLKRRMAGTVDRLFVQADGRRLPFADQSFDEVFALQSTYQIPFEDRVKVFEELMRVGKVVRVGPIFGEDYDALSKLAEKYDFEILESTDFSEFKLTDSEGGSVILEESFESYERRTKALPWARRWQRPRVEEPHFDPTITGRLRPNTTLSGTYGRGAVCRMILKKRSKEMIN